MIHPDVRSRADHPAVPTCHSAGRRAQGRSSRAAGPRNSGLCLTGPSTADNMSIIDRKTMKAVGQTVLQVLYQE